MQVTLAPKSQIYVAISSSLREFSHVKQGGVLKELSCNLNLLLLVVQFAFPLLFAPHPVLFSVRDLNESCQLTFTL